MKVCHEVCTTTANSCIRLEPQEKLNDKYYVPYKYKGHILKNMTSNRRFYHLGPIIINNYYLTCTELCLQKVIEVTTPYPPSIHAKKHDTYTATSHMNSHHMYTTKTLTTQTNSVHTILNNNLLTLTHMHIYTLPRNIYKQYAYIKESLRVHSNIMIRRPDQCM